MPLRGELTAVLDNTQDTTVDVVRPLITDLTSIAHDGKVVVVGTAPDGVLYYTVRQSGFEDSALSSQVEQTMPGFENWQAVPLGLATDDPSVRAYEAANLVDGDGHPIVRSVYGVEAQTSAIARVALVSGLGHLYLFRVSGTNRLLLNRFVLDGMTNSLVPKLQVRFRRSGQKLVPDGGLSPTGTGATQDSLGFRDVADLPFYEPAQELGFLGEFDPDKPWFSVELLPTAEHERHRWSFFAYTGGELRLVSVAASRDGLLDPKDQTKTQQDPNKVDTTILRTIPGIVDRVLRFDGTVVDAFDSTIYHNQVERQTKAGPQLLKENTRVMLSVPIEQPGSEARAIATVSFGVNNLGQLAQIDRVADRDELLSGDVKEVLLPLTDLDEITLIADRTPPPIGGIAQLRESGNSMVSVEADVPIEGKLRTGQQVKISGTRSYNGVYVARDVTDGAFTIDVPAEDNGGKPADAADPASTDGAASADGPASTDGAGAPTPAQGSWEVLETDDRGLVFENMIASYERTENGGLTITCLSHNLDEGDEIKIEGSVRHDGVYPITAVGEDNSFEIDQVWPMGEVVNLSRRSRRGLTFDGTGDYVQAAGLEFPAHRSDARLERLVSAWVYLDTNSPEPQTVFATTSELFHLVVDGDGALRFSVGFADGHRATVVDPEPLQERTWVHVAALLDYGGESTGRTTLSLCRNGRVAASTTVAPHKPLHLPLRNLHLDGQALPISTLQYDMPQPAAVTMEAWIRTRQPGRGVVASWYQNGFFALAVERGPTDGDARTVQWWTGSHELRGTVDLTDDDWHHLAVTYDPATGDKAIYVNGQQDTTATAPGALDAADRRSAVARAGRAKATKKPLWLGFLGAAATDSRVKGWDANLVHHDGGGFEQTGTRQWHSLNGRGKPTGDPLVELARDEWSIYLRDSADSYRIQLDLWVKQVFQTDRNVVSPAGEVVSSVAVNGENTNRVDFDGGSWQRTGGTRWRRFDASGRPTGEVLDESSRDQWSVYFQTPNGAMQFDLWRKKISQTVGGNRTDRHDITASAAPVSTASVKVNGRNTTRVDYADGSWQQGDGGLWRHVDKRGNATGNTMTESNRDEWSVYFQTPAGFMQFDLWRKKISRNVNGTRTDLDDITGASVPEFDALVALTGANARRIDVTDGRYEEVKGRRWQRFDSDGEPVAGRLREVSRDDWSVVLRDRAAGYSLRLDLWRRTVERIDDRVRRAIHEVTDASGLARDADPKGRFTGSLADVRLWRRARTAEEITKYADFALTGTETDLVAHWPLAETTAAELSDTTKSKAHISVPDPGLGPTRRLAWWVEPHRAPGTRSQYEGLAYDEALTVAADLDHSDRYAVELDGTSGYLSVPPIDENLARGLTIAAWVRWDSFRRWSQLIELANETDSAADAVGAVALGNRATSNTLVLTTPTGSLEAPDVLPTGQWVHVAATVDEQGRAQLYVDGEPVAAGDVGTWEDDAWSSNYLGRSNAGGHALFHGALREVQLWGRALAAGEIATFRQTPPQGIEPGLWHYWPMRTNLIDGKQRVVDLGTGTALHAEPHGGAASARLDADLPPVPHSGLRGKVCDVQLWDVNRPVETIRETMHDQLTGNEYGLVGYWRLGGILADPSPGSTRRLTPDFAADPHDALVAGDTYVSARELPRQNSVGRAVRYSNTDLVAVRQGARYRESVEFRVIDGDGDHWLAGDLDDADGHGNRIFEFGYWGQRTRTSEERVDFRSDQPYDFVDLGDGWFRAQCDITIPTDVNLIRSFEVRDVRGRWSSEQEPPEGEWELLQVRRHRLDLISDSISRRSYLDDLELPTLLDSASELADAVRTIPTKERDIAAKRVELAEIIEALKVFTNRKQFEQERDALVASSTQLQLAAAELKARIDGFEGDILNYRYLLRAKEAGKPVDLSGRDQRTVFIWDEHGGTNQAWEFQRQGNGEYKIACVRGGKFLTAAAVGGGVFVTSGDNPRQYWTVVELGNGHHAFRNTATRGVLDVYGHGRRNGDRIVPWPQNGKNNQAFRLVGWFPEYGRARVLFASPLHKQFVRQAVRGRYPKGAQRKSTYAKELGQLVEQFQRLHERLTTELARLTWLRGVLANQTPQQEAALRERLALLEEQVRTLQDEINGLNSDYIETARRVASEPQTMGLVAEDPLGLQTYGAVLAFASPTSGVTSTATAEGNVQLGYFDDRGRMRLTDYDATSDSANAAYEQWLPSTVAVCPDLSRPQAMVRLDPDSPVPVNPGAHTTEAWFSYPLPFTEDNTAYPVNYLTSDATGAEATIAVAANRRLGTVVDGFFHDAGVDLTTRLDRGWHHVAARAEGSVTLFYLDGQPVGHDTEQQLAIDRFQATFAGGPAGGSTSHLRLQPMLRAQHDYSNGFSLQGWVRWDSLAHWSRVFDFGNGSNSDNVLLGNVSTGPHLGYSVRHGNQNMGTLVAKDVIRPGEWLNVAVTAAGGITVLYVNGTEVARGELPNPRTVNRQRCYIGLSNWWDVPGTNDQPFHGAMSDLHVWNRGLSAPEIQRFMYEPPAADEIGLLHHWPMRPIETGGDGGDGGDGELRAEDVTELANHAWLGAGNPDHGVATLVLDKTVTAPIAALGNRATGGAPAGTVAEYRFWSVPLSSEEIAVNALVQLTGNEPELVACYPLTDVVAPGAVARDITGWQRPGTLEAAQPVARTANIGHPGASVLDFDGDSTRVTIPDIELRGQSFTIEYWLKRVTAGRGDWIVQQGRPRRNQQLHLGFRRDNRYAFAFYGNDLNHQVGELGVNQWVHVAHTYDTRSRMQTLFVNGKQVARRTAARLQATGDLVVGGSFRGNLAELRIWDHVRSQGQLATGYNRRATGHEPGLLSYLPLDDVLVAELVPERAAPTVSGTVRAVRTDDLPLRPAGTLTTAEYSTVEPDPVEPNRQRAVLRRCYAFAEASGAVTLRPGKRVEELQLTWIGNAQFEPTLLGFIEGAPPVPSENLTINYDYDAATSVELVQSDDITYSWNRNRDIGGGLDANFFLGAGWSTSGGAFIESQISEGHVGVRGNVNAQWRRSTNSTVRAQSTETSRDRLDLRGSYETDPAFPHLGNRFVPKNVGYALVVSGLADVFVTKMKRTGRMVAYEVLPVDDVPPDVNTITFMINPAYTLNGSLDGLVGSLPADERFYRHVPQMRAQYGSRYPASYFDLRQAYDLKSQIDRWDAERESYFTNFDARETGLGDGLLDQVADEDSYGDYGQVEVADGTEEGGEDGEGSTTSEADARKEVTAAYERQSEGGKDAAKAKRDEIEGHFADEAKQLEANAAFESWQRRMEGLKIRAAKRNIVNTCVWDADGGTRFEEQSFANTIEHTIGGSFSLNASLGLDANVTVTGFKFELQAMGTFEMSQTMSKTATSNRSFDLNVRLDGVEKKGVTDPQDYPVMPGEKVDRYRFMSFYLEGDTNHFSDFFSQVVDPEWLMSNDEEARALRQVARGRPNKAWRVMHRVTYVERPALMGFGRDRRTDDNLEAASEEVFNYFDALEQSSDALRSDIGEVKTQLGQVSRKLDDLGQSSAGMPVAPAAANGAAGNGAAARGAFADRAEADGASDEGPEASDGPVVDLTSSPSAVDLNLATAAELTDLNGVGPEIAALIVEHRERIGGFTSVDQLTDVPGIGPAKLAELRPLLSATTDSQQSEVGVKGVSS